MHLRRFGSSACLQADDRAKKASVVTAMRLSPDSIGGTNTIANIHRSQQIRHAPKFDRFMSRLNNGTTSLKFSTTTKPMSPIFRIKWWIDNLA
jgi:hypothetical protein